MKQTFLLIHGTNGRPERNWLPWLTWKLISSGHDVFVPRMPTPEGQSLKAWQSALEKQVPDLSQVSVAIGHSTGVPFLLRMLESGVLELKGLVLVSGFCQSLGLSEIDPLIKTFVEGDFNWDAIRSKVAKSIIFHGTDDPYVRYTLGKEVADNLQGSFQPIEGGKHFNTEAGYFQFDRLFDALKNLY